MGLDPERARLPTLGAARYKPFGQRSVNAASSLIESPVDRYKCSRSRTSSTVSSSVANLNSAWRRRAKSVGGRGALSVPSHPITAFSRSDNALRGGLSPNTVQWACPTCHGLGRVFAVTEKAMMPDDSLTIRERAVAAWPTAWHGQTYAISW